VIDAPNSLALAAVNLLISSVTQENSESPSVKRTFSHRFDLGPCMHFNLCQLSSLVSGPN
jgi:hypothetical protein